MFPAANKQSPWRFSANSLMRNGVVFGSARESVSFVTAAVTAVFTVTTLTLSCTQCSVHDYRGSDG